MTEEVWDERLEWVADEWEVEIPRDVKRRKYIGCFFFY